MLGSSPPGTCTCTYFSLLLNVSLSKETLAHRVVDHVDIRLKERVGIIGASRKKHPFVIEQRSHHSAGATTQKPQHCPTASSAAMRLTTS